MSKPILKMLRGPRALDIFKCFRDMSLRDASVICKIGFSTLKSVKVKLDLHKKWDFHDLRAGKVCQSKWDEIKSHRERIIEVRERGTNTQTFFCEFLLLQEIYFAEIREILLKAARRGALLKKLCGPKILEDKANAFVQGLKETYQANPYSVMWQPVIEAMSPTAPVPEQTGQPALPNAQTVVGWRPVLVQKQPTSIPAAIIDSSRAPVSPDTEASKTPEDDRGASRIFADIWHPPTREQIRAATETFYAKSRTPWHVWTSMQEFYETRYSRLPYGRESMLEQDPRVDRLPDIEPLTDWGWLEHTGVRAPESES